MNLLIVSETDMEIVQRSVSSSIIYIIIFFVLFFNVKMMNNAKNAFYYAKFVLFLENWQIIFRFCISFRLSLSKPLFLY